MAEHITHNNTTPNPQVRVLVVKQNWLLEYLPNETRAPVGFIHLEVRGNFMHGYGYI